MTQPWLGLCFVQWLSAPGFKLGKACGYFCRYWSMIFKGSPPTWSSYPVGFYLETKETCHWKQAGSPKITGKNAWWQYGFAALCSHSFAIRKKKKVSYRTQKMRNKKKMVSPKLIIKSGVQIVIIQEGELQHWNYYLRLVASVFCETILLR